ncbi:hypothetical protein K490DRAFT_62729 [Saccharata proteae CBS 121410]|uniref:Uncharacterized protein n=1 Tax=Saccharata proteae CBS 121410 TaxID=1314787 RepID=A0A9P4I096_9PEZI|nr:hypothetical protein K490DRAFT_62729 [Saccharata proteae CBS 121410]
MPNQHSHPQPPPGPAGPPQPPHQQQQQPQYQPLTSNHPNHHAHPGNSSPFSPNPPGQFVHAPLFSPTGAPPFQPAYASVIPESVAAVAANGGIATLHHGYYPAYESTPAGPMGFRGSAGQGQGQGMGYGGMGNGMAAGRGGGGGGGGGSGFETMMAEETFEERERRSYAARILESNEMLIWMSSTRNESIPQTRLHFEKVVAGIESDESDKEWENSNEELREAEARGSPKVKPRQGERRVNGGSRKSGGGGSSRRAVNGSAAA